MKKNIIKLNESQLHKIVAESVKKVLKEVKRPRYYVDIDGEQFYDFNMAYDHAYEIAEELREEYGEDMEDVVVVDNIKEEIVLRIRFDGIYNLENGAYRPW